MFPCNTTNHRQLSKKSIFLTGATGFLGKIIIEKLLRSCDIENFYILVRNKKGKGLHLRVDDIFDDPVSNKFSPKKKST